MDTAEQLLQEAGVHLPDDVLAGDEPLPGLLDQVEHILTKYVWFPDDHGPVALTLWVAATHASDAFDVATYMNISSPEKRSGKSRVLELAEHLVRSPLRVDNATPAYIYRSMAGSTLLLDESDKVFAGKDEYSAALTGALNSGWRRGAGAGRVDKNGSGLTPVKFDAFGPKILAGIGRKVPDTIQDRSIPLHLERKAPGEQVARLRFRKLPGETALLRDALAAWAASATGELSHAEPDLPDELHDRAQDIWEPLLAVADLAGADWPRRARRAAVALHGAFLEDDSNGVRLLRDIYSIVIDKIGSTDLASALNAIEESPWGGWPLDSRKLARDLRPFGIRPKKIRLGEATVQGYEREQFTDAWRRYTPDLIGASGTSGTPGTAQVASTSTVPFVPDVPVPPEGKSRVPEEEADPHDVARDLLALHKGDGLAVANVLNDLRFLDRPWNNGRVLAFVKENGRACPECSGVAGHTIRCSQMAGGASQ